MVQKIHPWGVIWVPNSGPYVKRFQIRELLSKCSILEPSLIYVSQGVYIKRRSAEAVKSLFLPVMGILGRSSSRLKLSLIVLTPPLRHLFTHPSIEFGQICKFITFKP